MDAHTAAQKAKVRIWPMRRIKRPLIKMPQANPTKKTRHDDADPRRGKTLLIGRNRQQRIQQATAEL